MYSEAIALTTMIQKSVVVEPEANIIFSESSFSNAILPLRRSKRLAISRIKTIPALSAATSKKKARSKQRKAPKLSKTGSDDNSTEQPSKPLYKLSSAIFPPLDVPRFGLAQEKVADNAFKVLVACIFLTRTKGSVSMPVCRELFRRHPTAQSLARANLAEITLMFQPLGLQNRRAKTVINLAKAWVECPPTYGRRYRKLHYPAHKDGSDISPSEQPIEDEENDPRVAWEVGHLPGVGAYALDSWRIFCRDSLRGIPHGLRDMDSIEGVSEERLQEWTRVVPLDKELIAYIRWRWLRLHYLWNPVDGSKIKVDAGLVERLQKREMQSYKDFDNPWIVYGAKFEDP